MIISASYKTDIPAFYGQWFVNRLRAGYCLMRNPINRKVIRVSMSPDHVDGIVFWTKNFRPFLKHEHEVERTGIPYVVQYTINGYPKSLETNVVEWQKSAETVRDLAQKHGPRCIVWRYDTIIFSRETPPEFHVENFRQISEALTGATDEVVISFLHLYRKTETNLRRMGEESGNVWWDPQAEEKRDMARVLFDLARRQGMSLTICSQPELLSVQRPSRCIDSVRLWDVGGRPVSAKTLGNRPGCECAASRDIGDYDTCPHGCVYCYAVRSNELAIKRFRLHDAESEFLFSDPSDPQKPALPESGQLRLLE